MGSNAWGTWVVLVAGLVACDSSSDASEAKPPAAKSDKPTKAESGKVEPTKAEPTKAEPTKAEPTKAEPTKAEPTKAEPTKAEPTAVAEGDIDTKDALVLPAMHWAPARPILDADPVLLVGGTVRDLKKAKTDDSRGEPWVVSARIEVEHVWADRVPKAMAGRKPEPLGTRKFVVAELADGLAVGERVIVYGVDYEGGQALIEREGGGTRLGIKVADWSDPIVAAVEALGAGKADLSDEAQRAAWKALDEGSLGCFAVRAHFDDCDPKCASETDPEACWHACAEKHVGATLPACDRDM